jgi:4-hydroxy-tetrahydrodipicolinate synthase
MAPMLAMGCDGSVNGMSGVMPDYFSKLYDLVTEGQIEKARTMQLGMLELFEAAVLAAEFPHGIRAAVAMRGFAIGPSRQPVGEAFRAAWPQVETRIRLALKNLGYGGA